MRLTPAFTLLFLILGILSGERLNSPFLIVAAICGTAVLNFIINLRFRYRFAFLFTVVSITGAVLGFNASHPNINTEIGVRKSYSGEITSVRQGNDRTQCFVKLSNGNKSFFYTKNHFNVGDYVIYDGVAENIRGKLNPTDFDAKHYYASKRIYYSLTDGNPILTRTNKSLPYYIYKAKNKLSSVYDAILPSTESGIIKAMILGDSSEIDNETYDSYRNSGIIHILCISGLHLSIIAYVLMLLLKPHIGERYAGIISLPFMILYCIFSGSSVSAVRAVIMLAFHSAAVFLYRDYSLLNSACTASAIILMHNPMHMYNTGFQYSFACVFIIGMVIDISEHYKIENKTAVGAISTAAVTTFIKPLTMYHYYTINFADIAANTAVMPLIAIIILLGLFAGLAGLFSISFAKFIIGMPYLMLRLINTVTSLSNNTPVSNIITGHISLYALIGFAIFIIILYNVLVQNISKHWRSAVIVTLALSYTPPKNEIVFPYIGHGDCAIISKDNYTALIDIGSSYYGEYGSRTILPYLKYIGKDTINELFISHADYDHIGGLYEIINSVKIERVYTSKTDTDNYKKLISLLNNNHIPVTELSAGDIIQPTDSIRYKIISPNDRYKDDNNNSMVLMLEYENSRLLFTGDIGEECEHTLIKSNFELNCDILKLPHHGAKNKYTAQFIKRVAPSAAIACVGINDKYKHPSPQTVESLDKLSVPLYPTNSGMIIINPHKRNITAFTNPKEILKY